MKQLAFSAMKQRIFSTMKELAFSTLTRPHALRDRSALNEGHAYTNVSTSSNIRAADDSSPNRQVVYNLSICPSARFTTDGSVQYSYVLDDS